MTLDLLGFNVGVEADVDAERLSTFCPLDSTNTDADADDEDDSLDSFRSDGCVRLKKDDTATLLF